MINRRNVRIPMRLSGQLALNGESHAVEAQNISLTGSRVTPCPPTAETNRACILTLFVLGETVSSITFSGVLAHVDDEDCGIAFLAVDAQDFRDLGQILKQDSPEPELFQKEIDSGFIPAVEDWRVA